MAISDLSWRQSLKQTFQSFFNYYRGSNTAYVSLTTATLLFGVNGFVSTQILNYALGGLAVLIFGSSIGFKYWEGRPFGISVVCVPTHVVDGEREPDKIGEQRGVALVQDGEVVLHGTTKMSKFNNEFEVQLKTSSDINAELRSIPRSEHKYDPKNNKLRCDEISEYEFPLTVEVFSKRSVAKSGRYHWFKIIDGSSGRTLVEFDVINVGRGSL